MFSNFSSENTFTEKFADETQGNISFTRKFFYLNKMRPLLKLSAFASSSIYSITSFV